MGKSRKKTIKKGLNYNKQIQELIDSRSGGQAALRGFSYQFLYSCYLIISESNASTFFQLEGVEDIDRIEMQNDEEHITNIQLKHSINKQDASFLNDVLKNFLEVYLLDSNRSFKLVYDFPVAKGNLSKLFESNLDEKAYKYWANVISKIQQENSSWDWSAYNFDDFLSKLSFEKIEKKKLTTEIENILCKKFSIYTDNISLYANSIKVLCFEKMEQREFFTNNELYDCIQNVSFDISKGSQNHAHSWIQKIDFSTTVATEDISFYEGKKATPSDIVMGLPIKRLFLEQDVLNSIRSNDVTIIKSSSGQGKTTLALNAAYTLKNEYIPYQLLWCNDTQELGSIVQYFRMRIRLGEKPLIIIDNLGGNLKNWNELVQLFQSELLCQYKVIITSREIDWYNYSGDISGIRSINVIKPHLSAEEAADIFNILKLKGKLHRNVSDWKSAWLQVESKQLLIEYIYLLTHGEMLSERITAQMKEINLSTLGKEKINILRKVCFADICGIKLELKSIISELSKDCDYDIGEILKSMENEFLIHVSEKENYIEGLHPVRSKHIFDSLHEYYPIESTAFSVIKMANRNDYPELFSHLSEFKLNREELCDNTVEFLWDKNDLSNYLSVIKGLYSGDIVQYYITNKTYFDDAKEHNGLPIILMDICPFTKFDEFGISVSTLDNMKNILPDNDNINFLCNLRDTIPKFSFYKTLSELFCKRVFQKMMEINPIELKKDNIENYANVVELIYNIDSSYNLSTKYSLEEIWANHNELSVECLASLMYISFCGNKDVYMDFVNEHIDEILLYLKHKTNSHIINIDKEKNSISVKYILQLNNYSKGNDESVNRLKYICKMLPIFDLYYSDALKPKIDSLSSYNIHDDAHKEMPINNIVIMFHQNLVRLWNESIQRNYEFDTVSEWIEYWFDFRKRICIIIDKFCSFMLAILGKKSIGNLATEIDQLRSDLYLAEVKNKFFPNESHPFEDKEEIPKGFDKIKNQYFQSIKNFINNFAEFILNDEKKRRIAMINLKSARSNLDDMQHFFEKIAYDYSVINQNQKICDLEKQSIEQLWMLCSFYQLNAAHKCINKNLITSWYNNHMRTILKSTEEKLSHLKDNYNVHFPINIYTINVLDYFPIVIDNFDLTSESSMSELILLCTPFVEAAFDYLVILFTDELGNLRQNALQFPKHTFEIIKDTLQMNAGSSDKQIDPPYPVEITEQMLNCFSEKYDMPTKIDNYNANHVGIIAEELWVYSLSKELLSNTEDENYLSNILKDTHTKIEKELALLYGKLSSNDYEQLSYECKKVFEGTKFGNSEFNELYNKYI